MRLVSYNVCDGGRGRVDALSRVIAAQRPDVVALVEASDEAVVRELATRLGMAHLRAPAKGSSAALLTAWPVRRSRARTLLERRPLLEAVVADPRTGTEWTVGAVHLSPHAGEADEAQRERELAELLDAFAAARVAGAPHLLAGDFNANAPAQAIDPRRCAPRTQQDWEANGRHIPRRVVARLLASGYVDTLAAVRGDEAAGETTTFTTEHPGQRLDYVFAFGLEARLREAWVYRDAVAREASDHYPIGVEIR